MQIQFDIPKEINKKLKIKKAKMEFKSISELILFILNKELKDD